MQSGLYSNALVASRPGPSPATMNPHESPEMRFLITMFRFIFRLLAAKAAAKVIARMFGSNAARGAAARGAATRGTRRY